MPTDISEKELETILVSYLRDHQGYEEGVSSDYNKEFGLDTERVNDSSSPHKKKRWRTLRVSLLLLKNTSFSVGSVQP